MKPDTLSVFEKWSEQSLLALDQAKGRGMQIAGIFCTYAPLELVRAAGAVPVSLCGKRQEPIAEAEKVLPASLCPLIKSSYGYAATRTCPFYNASDMVIGETTCDGKKKMFEILKNMKPFFLLQLPYAQDDPGAFKFWMDQVFQFKSFLESRTGQGIHEDVLQEQIVLQNKQRRLLREILDLNARGPALVTGMDMLPVMESASFVVDLGRHIQALEDLRQEMIRLREQGDAHQDQARRILITGCPLGKGSEKVLRIIEDSGAVVVGMENCTGIKSFGLLVEESGNPFENVARRYLETPCSCMTPNEKRFDLVGRLARELEADGIVDMTWQFCHTYNVETHFLQQIFRKDPGLPCLHIETDYTDNDTEQIRTRVEAFMEMLS